MRRITGAAFLVALGEFVLEQLPAFGREFDVVPLGVLLDVGQQSVEIRVRARADGLRDSIHQLSERFLSCVDADPVEPRARFLRQVEPQTQGPLDSKLPIAERLVGENLGLLVFLERQKGLADPLDVLVGELTVLFAEVPP